MAPLVTPQTTDPLLVHPGGGLSGLSASSIMKNLCGSKDEEELTDEELFREDDEDCDEDELLSD